MGPFRSPGGMVARIGVALVLAVVVTFLTGAATGEKVGATIRGELTGSDGEPQQVRLTLPTGDTRPKGVVVWFHGQGGNVNDKVDGPFLSALTRDGWAIASSNFHAQAWGNPESSEDAALLLDWVEEQIDMVPALWVSGSMGGAVSLNAMLHGAEPPACWYGVKPAIALTEMEEVPGGPGFIRAAFGGPVPADSDPIENVDQLPMTTRYRIAASQQDQWVLYDENAGRLLSELETRGADVSEFKATGLHDDPSHFNPVDLVEFADSCLK